MRPAALASQHFPGGPLSSAVKDKTRPVHMLMGALRHKTRPAPHGGTPEPGQNSPCTHAGMPEPVQNSPSTHAGMPEPVENSPCTATITDFCPFSACRAKIVTLQPETTAAGRIFSHRERKQPQQGDLCCTTSGMFLSRSSSSSWRPSVRTTESSRWLSHGVHFHHVT